MSNVTKEYQDLINLSDRLNPYHPESKIRNFWSEGFRAGYEHKRKEAAEFAKNLREILCKEEWCPGCGEKMFMTAYGPLCSNKQCNAPGVWI
jgi:NADH pyrophosphatase NudC (nudix superfamily)